MPKKVASKAEMSASPSKKSKKADEAPAKSKKAKAAKTGGKKRAPTPFFVFSAEKRPEVKAAHPDWKVTQVASELGKMWGKLSDEEKASYKGGKKASGSASPKKKSKKGHDNDME